MKRKMAEIRGEIEINLNDRRVPGDKVNKYTDLVNFVQLTLTKNDGLRIRNPSTFTPTGGGAAPNMHKTSGILELRVADTEEAIVELKEKKLGRNPFTRWKYSKSIPYARGMMFCGDTQCYTHTMDDGFSGFGTAPKDRLHGRKSDSGEWVQLSSNDIYSEVASAARKRLQDLDLAYRKKGYETELELGSSSMAGGAKRPCLRVKLENVERRDLETAYWDAIKTGSKEGLNYEAEIPSRKGNELLKVQIPILEAVKCDWNRQSDELYGLGSGLKYVLRGRPGRIEKTEKEIENKVKELGATYYTKLEYKGFKK